MSAPIVHSHRFVTADHWRTGLFVKLRPLEGRGLALFSRPTVAAWLTVRG